ncbi:MAG: secretin and TonB N-terminal domain-containing protein [Myxococcota bacterium]
MMLAWFFAASPPPPRISVEFEDTDVHAALRLIAEHGDVNLVVGDDVTGTVTMRLVDVRWEDAFAAVLAAEGLAAVRVGEVWRVSALR